MSERLEITVRIADEPEVRAAMKDAAERIAVLEVALAEAVVQCSGRVSSIGKSQVYTPQIDTRAADRWRRALAGAVPSASEPARTALRDVIAPAKRILARLHSTDDVIEGDDVMALEAAIERGEMHAAPNDG